jgi:hypothetical protein
MPRGGANRASVAVKRRYFQLIRQGLRGAAAARRAGVSTSCGSLWFIDAGGVMIHDPGRARDRGALADQIPGDPAHAGIGFVMDDRSRLPVRFRAGWVTDRDIDELVARATPTHRRRPALPHRHRHLRR